MVRNALGYKSCEISGTTITTRKKYLYITVLLLVVRRTVEKNKDICCIQMPKVESAL